MLENQFIRINELHEDWTMKPFPVMLSTSGNDYLNIFVEGDVSKIAVLKKNGTEVSASFTTTTSAYKLVTLNTLINNASLSDGEPFTLKSYKGATAYRYSNLLMRIPFDSEWLYVKYSCNEDAFGFPFSLLNSNSGVTARLPIRKHSPQNVQDDKTYVKADGEVVTLYAKYYKEWECLTEFVSEAMHDKIVAALSCDEVYININNKRVTKSDKYQVDWDNYDLDCDGVTKLAKATFKVREHITQRNSNY